MIQRFTFTELSEQISITKASILRFCKKIGYSGYNEFKFDCIKYVNSIKNIAIENTNTPLMTNIGKVSNLYSDIIKLMEKVIDEKEILKLVEQIKVAKRIRAVGVVNSSLTCLQLRYAFLMFGVEISVVQSLEELKTIDLMLKEDDLTIIFSVSAKHDIVYKAIELTKNCNGTLSIITMNSESKHREIADSFIVLPSVSNLKNQSLLDSVPLFSVFIEILIFYYSA